MFKYLFNKLRFRKMKFNLVTNCNKLEMILNFNMVSCEKSQLNNYQLLNKQAYSSLEPWI